MNATVIDMPIVERRPQTTDQALALVSGAKAMLDKATTVDELQDAHTLAAVGKTFLKARADARAAYLMAAETELRAERKLGEWLARQPKAKGGRPSETEDSVSQVTEAPRLADIGITRHDSKRWQKLAEVKHSVFEAYVSNAVRDGRPPTAAGARRLAAAAPSNRPQPKLTGAPALRASWERSEDRDQLAFLAIYGMVPEVALTELRRQRDADPAFAALRIAQRAASTVVPSQAQRMLNFVLDGGEHALAVLGLDWTVTLATLQSAYAAASRSHHPDRGGNADAFTAITRAYKKVKAFLGE